MRALADIKWECNRDCKNIHLLSVHSIQNALNESYHAVIQERVQVYDMMIIGHTVMPGR